MTNNEAKRTGDIVKAILEPPNDADSDGIPQSLSKPSVEFPVHAFPKGISAMIVAVSSTTGTDPSLAAVAVMAIMAGCVGNRVAALVKPGWTEPAILWAALVGKSGSTKTAVLRLLTEPLIARFKMERGHFEEKMRQHDSELERFAAKMASWKLKQKSGPPTDPPVKPDQPTERRIVVSDATIEKLVKLLGENPMGVLAVWDELAGLINSFNRYAGGKGSDMQSWLSMHDGCTLLVDRKTDGSTFVERASVSILGTIQPYTLEQVFGKKEREAGLLARMLLAFPPARPALWTDDELPEDVANQWRDLVYGLLALEPAYDDEGHARPRTIGMAPEARRNYVKWHDDHAREVADLTDDHLRSHWAKLKGMCVRIALLFACVEAVECGRVNTISTECIERAIRITGWLKSESARIYSQFSEGEIGRERRELIAFIERRGGEVTVRELTHSLRRYRSDSPAAKRVLNELVELGLGRWVTERPSAKGGRPSEKFVWNGVDIDTDTKTVS